MSQFQHYVPRVYLEGFTDPQTPSGQSPYVWVIDLVSQTVKRRAPKKIAGERDYYESVGITGGPGAGVEQRLSKIETHFKSAVQDIMSRPSGQYQFDSRLLWFLATLGVRTPWARRAMEEHMAEYPARKSRLSKLSQHELWAASVEYLATWCAEYFRRMQWILIGPKDPTMHFVTSDRPVVLTGNNMDGSTMDVLRLTEGCSVVTVPLTSHLAMIGSYSPEVFFKTGVTVQWINKRTTEHAERYIYSPKGPE